jgi:tetratricopeptide (TPR) repeat protein
LRKPFSYPENHMTTRIVRLSALLAYTWIGSAALAQTTPTPTPTPAAAAAVSAATLPTLRAEVRTPLLEAQTLLSEKNYVQAKIKTREASGVANKTPYEDYVTTHFALSIANGEDDAPAAAKFLERVLQLSANETWLKPEEAQHLMHAVGITHYRAKDYAQAAVWLDRNIKAGGTEQSAKDARIQSYLLSGNLQRGSELINEEIRLNEKAGKTPTQRYLEMLAQARNGLKDSAGSTRALEMLVQYYPSKDHWRSLINRLWGRADLAPQLQLDVFRLAFFTGTPEEASDYSEYIEFAQKAGFSAEALRVFDQGVTAGQMGSTDAHKKLRVKLSQEVEQDRKTMAVDTAAALKKPDGLALFNIGFNMVGMQQVDKGLDLMEKAIAKGLAKRPTDARFRLAVAYAQAEQTEKALQTFATTSGPEGLDDLVRYWKWALRKP